MTPAPFEQVQNLSSINGVNHGFFGRIGHGGNNYFNCSLIVGNQAEQAKLNRIIAKNAIAGDDAILASVQQIHSNKVINFISPNTKNNQQADALVTATKGIALSILTADCSPILFADKSNGVIGAAHAGWQGALNGIIKNTINAMIEMGAKTKNIVAAIGPTISGSSYEIGFERATDMVKINYAAKEFIFIPSGANREHFDLPKFVAFELKKIGIKNIEETGICTAKNPQEYFSHRYATNNNAPQGRQISIISLI